MNQQLRQSEKKSRLYWLSNKRLAEQFLDYQLEYKT